jgi:DNA-binding SARP family transcriptional activator/Tfp pilus assembly protein PilF
MLSSRSPGYALRLDADGDLDADQFEAWAAQGIDALRTGDAERAAAVLAEALDLWRGPALVDVPASTVIQAEADRLEESRLVALEARVDSDLALGRHADLVPELMTLTQDHPLRERLWEQLMLGLYRAGRQADALAAYQSLYRHLDDEVGVEPGPSVRELHQRILANDPELDHVGSTEPVAEPTDVPRQLPTAVRHFAGRERELEVLDELLAESQQASALVITAIAGTAGVGKTATAVYWAHRVAEQFPDGQLYVDLRGFEPSATPVTPAVAVRGFLDALAVSPERIPATVEAQVGLYRSLVAERRMLVVLDNARDVDQVRPLLPGGSGCLVVVTSRSQLSGLVAAEGAHLIPLDLLSDHEARELLVRHIGPEPVGAEPDAVAAIIERCARLPLALSVAAAHAVLDPSRSLAGLASELAESRARLDLLDAGEPTTNVRAVLSWSYRGQSSEAQRLFRLLGVHPGPDVTAPAAASLAGIAVDDARRLLDELRRAHLVTELSSGRYAFHDLLRAYAIELTESGDGESERCAATRRMLDHYLHTAHAAAQLLSPHRGPIDLADAAARVTPETLTRHEQAITWFAAERPVLIAAVTRAAEWELDTHAWQLAWTLVDFLDWQGHWHDWITTQQVALDAARRRADRPQEGTSHRYLATAHTRLGDLDDARTHLERSRDLCAELGDHAGQARVELGLGSLSEKLGRNDEVLDHDRKALELFRAAGDLAGQADALNGIGWTYALRGDYSRSLEFCRQALDLQERLGYRHGQAATWDSLGYVHHRLGDHTEAIACYTRAYDLYREIGGDRYYETDVLMHLGEAHRAAGDPDAARDAWQRALDVLGELDHPDVDRVRAMLEELGR